MRTNDRPKADAAAAELRRTQRSLTGTPRTFLLVRFFVVPLTSAIVFVLCVPARRFASCQLTTRLKISARTSTAKTLSASSIEPTFWLSKLTISHFIAVIPSLLQKLQPFLPELPPLPLILQASEHLWEELSLQRP